MNPRCNWPSALTVDAALLGAGVSIGAGILFGLWPACQAAGVNPIEALRFE
ncbi:MAG: ABC transporter permease [Planctomycetes bacterium]|nr:ABC transporter permease [Planctomycetota bacterium]